MEVKVSYCPEQLEAAIKYISSHNNNFLGQDDEIRETIMSSLRNLINDFPHSNYRSTMGFVIIAADIETESMDCDENLLRIEFLVDPSLSNKNFESYNERIYHTKDKVNND